MSHAIGIIGGADGPTAIFITGNPLPGLLAAAGLAVLVFLAIRYFKKR